MDGPFAFGLEESASASFLRTDGGPSTTDKGSPLLVLLASEILARTGRSASEQYGDLVAQHADVD
ncbi:hypothetical protein [Nocardioides sp. 503]|uniref:hypothetical protein n=1 Tax=Nocardioides sp. 503 TaxID=2508326 RepID=UPI001FD68571|nr:hypothetical protein [Nocardioides sp. 503]